MNYTKAATAEKIKFLYDEKLLFYRGYSLIFRRRAFAIPLVILLSVVLMIFAFMLINSNTQSKKQRNSTILTTKAYFMAQAGLQHMKLKYKLLPEELFKCSCMHYGFSPFYVPPGGAKFDQFDNAGDAKTRYPEYLAAYVEDINSYENDPDGSASGAKTSAGYGPLVKIQGKEVKSAGGCSTWPFTIGGFGMEDADAKDTIAEWGYKIVNIKAGSLKKESDPAVLQGGLPYIEQSITIEIEGRAKTNVGGKNVGESEFREHKLTETILLKRQLFN